jgi:hypothetical protein
VIAKTLLHSAKFYKSQMQEVQTLLAQEPVTCPRLVELLDSLANAPHYDEMNEPLWNRRGRPGIEGQLWTLKDAYKDGVNQFRLDTFRVIRKTCAAGGQPTAEQRQAAMSWLKGVNPASKMDHVIDNLDPVVGP